MEVSVTCPSVSGRTPPVHTGELYEPVILGSQLFLLCSTREGGLFSLNLDTMAWRLVDTHGEGPPEDLNHPATALIGSKMYIIGGQLFLPVVDIWTIDLETFQWNRFARQQLSVRVRDLPGGNKLTAVYSQGSLYVANLDENKMWALDLKDRSWNLVWIGEMNFQIMSLRGNNDALLGLFKTSPESNFWTMRWVAEGDKKGTWALFSSDKSELTATYVIPQQTSSVFLTGLFSVGYHYLHLSEYKWRPLLKHKELPLELASLTNRTSFLYRDTVYVMGHENVKFKMVTITPKESFLRGPSHVVSELAHLLDSPYTDFKLIPKEGAQCAVPVVKAVLAARWRWFNNLLQSGMGEVHLGAAHIPKGREVVLALVTFLYTGSLLRNSVKTLTGLAKLANMYQMLTLRTAVRESLCSLLDKESCVKVFMCGVKIQDPQLIESAAACIVANLQEVFQSEEFAALFVDAEAKEVLARFLHPSPCRCKKRPRDTERAGNWPE
mmetsp:Transcript_699/g.1176  ORF Transcript_699/g.1176 Transcript_699/m.1176 type:complete len:495 (-) Transcript_699:315-1799(-)